jgi:hypothetical protein
LQCGVTFTQFQALAEGPAYLEHAARTDRHAQAQHLVHPVALLGAQVVEFAGHHARVALQQRGLAPLEVPEPLLPVPQDTELPLGEFPGLLQGGKLRAQFVEGDQPVGGHVLEACAPAVGLRQLLQPRLLLS